MSSGTFSSLNYLSSNSYANIGRSYCCDSTYIISPYAVSRGINQKRKKRWKFHQLSHMWRTRKRVNHTDNWTTISAILRNYLITFPYGSQNVWMNLETLGDHNVMTPKWDATILIKCGANVYIRFHWLRCFCHGKFL